MLARRIVRTALMLLGRCEQSLGLTLVFDVVDDRHLVLACA